MRNLTIKRIKSVVACMGRMKVYIEDPATGDLTINGIACRKLGELKNGEEKTFRIGEEAAKIFVIADTLSRNFSNDFFALPQGQEDIALTGKNRFNPAAGNPFIFNGNADPKAHENRKKGTRRGLIILAVAAVVGFLGGYLIASGIRSVSQGAKQDFRYEDMQITLTKKFSETDAENFDFAYSSRDVLILGLKEELALNPALKGYTSSDYAAMVINNNGLSTSAHTDGGMTVFSYDTEEGYHYVAYIYQTDDAFWMLQFCTTSKNAEAKADQITRWARSVTFEE